MEGVRVVVEPSAPESVREVVELRLGLFNAAATGVSDYYPVNAVLRGPHDEVLGAALGHVWGTWLHVELLWVAGLLRGQGHGRALLQAAEQYAVARGARHARLDTLSFQAPGFYAKLGYEVFGRLDDYPPGHTLYFLRKRLAASDEQQTGR